MAPELQGLTRRIQIECSESLEYYDDKNVSIAIVMIWNHLTELLSAILL